jgi:competence protein ComEC
MLLPLRFMHGGHRIAALLAIVAIWFYAIMSGASPSVVRAAVMLSVLQLSLATSARYNSLNALAVTVFAMLVYRPSYLFDISFQLSFLAVLGILVCVPIIERFLSKHKTKNFFKPIIQNATISLSAQAFTAPIIIYNFKTFPILFLLTNIIVVPFLGFVLISIITLILFVDIPLLNTITSVLVEIELEVLIAIANFFKNLTLAITI